jgi:hypothetical protein
VVALGSSTPLIPTTIQYLVSLIRLFFLGLQIFHFPVRLPRKTLRRLFSLLISIHHLPVISSYISLPSGFKIPFSLALLRDFSDHCIATVALCYNKCWILWLIKY